MQSSKIEIDADHLLKDVKGLKRTILRQHFNLIYNHINENGESIFQYINDDFLETLIEKIALRYSRPVFIAVTGESASGKSTFTKQICKTIKEHFGENSNPLQFISCDNYYNDISSLIKKFGNFDKLLENGYNVDSPESFQMELLRKDLIKLRNNQCIKMPRYLINGTGISLPEQIHVEPLPVVIVEGIASMYDEIRDLFDIKIYVDIDHEIQIKRYLNRAIDRNQSREDAYKQFCMIEQLAKKFLRPLKNDVDIVINGNSIIEDYEFITKSILNSLDLISHKKLSQTQL